MKHKQVDNYWNNNHSWLMASGPIVLTWHLSRHRFILCHIRWSNNHQSISINTGRLMSYHLFCFVNTSKLHSLRALSTRQLPGQKSNQTSIHQSYILWDFHLLTFLNSYTLLSLHQCFKYQFYLDLSRFSYLSLGQYTYHQQQVCIISFEVSVSAIFYLETFYTDTDQYLSQQTALQASIDWDI